MMKSLSKAGVREQNDARKVLKLADEPRASVAALFNVDVVTLRRALQK